MGVSVDIAKCKNLFRWLNVVLIVWAVPMALIIFRAVLPSDLLYDLVLGLHIVAALWLFSLLGILASHNQRSWVRL